MNILRLVFYNFYLKNILNISYLKMDFSISYAKIALYPNIIK